MPIRSSDWVFVEYSFRILAISVSRQHIKYKLPQAWARIQLCMYICAQVADQVSMTTPTEDAPYATLRKWRNGRDWGRVHIRKYND